MHSPLLHGMIGIKVIPAVSPVFSRSDGSSTAGMSALTVCARWDLSCCGVTQTEPAVPFYSTGCPIMIAPPPQPKPVKTLAKLLLYYNSLNKVTLLCKVSDWCVLFIFLNQELQIRNLCGRQQQQQQHPACAGMTVAVQRIIHWLWRTVCKFDNKVWCEYHPRPSSFNMRSSIRSLMIAFRIQVWRWVRPSQCRFAV